MLIYLLQAGVEAVLPVDASQGLRPFDGKIVRRKTGARDRTLDSVRVRTRFQASDVLQWYKAYRHIST